MLHAKRAISDSSSIDSSVTRGTEDDNDADNDDNDYDDVACENAGGAIGWWDFYDTVLEASATALLDIQSDPVSLKRKVGNRSSSIEKEVEKRPRAGPWTANGRLVLALKPLR